MAAQQEGAQQVDISQLPLQQLNMLAQQLDQEIEFFATSLQQLKGAQSKFVESQECLDKVNPERADKDILVPLTSSMYVPGQLCDVEDVMVDIGTGYFVEKSVTGAKSYFQRKVDYVQEQMKKIQPVVEEKYKMKQALTETIQYRMHQQAKPPQAAAKS